MGYDAAMKLDRSDRRSFALVGDPFVVRAVRDGISFRTGQSFVSVKQVVGGHAFTVLQADDGARTYFGIDTDFVVAPFEARVKLLVSLGVDAVLIASTHAEGFATCVSLARALGTVRVAGATRTGTRVPTSADEEGILEMEHTFGVYAALGGFSAGAPFVRVAIEEPREAAQSVDRALDEACTQDLPHAPHGARSFACKTCGARVTGEVTVIDSVELARLESLHRAPIGDESLVPLAHVLRGDGTLHRSGHWRFAADTFYFHRADWLDPDAHGSGLFGCCGVRPDPTKGFNLTCPNGHLLGALYSDCCSPQGVHVPEQNLVAIDASRGEGSPRSGAGSSRPPFGRLA